jgi:hypothetical protein
MTLDDDDAEVVYLRDGWMTFDELEDRLADRRLRLFDRVTSVIAGVIAVAIAWMIWR